MRRFTKRELAGAGLIAVLFLLMGIRLFAEEFRNDTVKQGFLLRGDYGSGPRTEELELQVEEERGIVEVQVDARRYAETEAKDFLDQAEVALPLQILGGQDPKHISFDLVFLDHIGDLPVTVSYLAYPAHVIRYDGTIMDGVAEKGEGATVEATLLCQDQTRIVRLPLTVFPKVLSGNDLYEKELNEAVAGEDVTSERVELPSDLNGVPVRISRRLPKSGIAVALLGFLAAFTYLYAIRQREAEAFARRRRSMMLDYPSIVNKLILYLGAGMSTRRAILRIGEDYQRIRKKRGPLREGMEAILRAGREMEHGHSEDEVYERLGEPLDTGPYRSLGLLLSQNLRKGNRELIPLLKVEADAAFEERKKQARILGEEAGTKLLFPMLLMLLTVLILILVPAFFGLHS